MIRWDERSRPGPVTGITAADVQGAQLSAARYVLEPDALVPEHAHENEEFGQVLRGTLELTTGGAVEQLAAGDAFLIAGNVPHAARAGSGGCELLECYAPPRAPR